MARESESYFATPEQMRRYKATAIARTVLTYLFLGLVGLFIVIPFLFMVINCFRNPDAYDYDNINSIFHILPSWFHPTLKNPDGSPLCNYTLENFVKIFTYKSSTGKTINFGVYYLNTLYVAICSTVFTIITSVLAAFAFARCNFKGKDVLWTVLLATMMVPGEMMVITNFQTVQALEWGNTFAALIFVHGVSVFYIFYLRQSFSQIPNELFLAAKVDGYGHFRYLLRVMVPIAMPTIVTIAILSLMGSWSSYIWPNLVSSGYNKFFPNWSMLLVSNGLMSLFQNSETGMSEDTVRIAGSVLVTVPLFIFFLIFRKYIMRGVSRSGIKG